MNIRIPQSLLLSPITAEGALHHKMCWVFLTHQAFHIVSSRSLISSGGIFFPPHQYFFYHLCWAIYYLVLASITSPMSFLYSLCKKCNLNLFSLFSLWEVSSPCIVFVNLLQMCNFKLWPSLCSLQLHCIFMFLYSTLHLLRGHIHFILFNHLLTSQVIF